MQGTTAEIFEVTLHKDTLCKRIKQSNNYYSPHPLHQLWKMQTYKIYFCLLSPATTKRNTSKSWQRKQHRELARRTKRRINSIKSKSEDSEWTFTDTGFISSSSTGDWLLLTIGISNCILGLKHEASLNPSHSQTVISSDGLSLFVYMEKLSKKGWYKSSWFSHYFVQLSKYGVHLYIYNGNKHIFNHIDLYKHIAVQ